MQKIYQLRNVTCTDHFQLFTAQQAPQWICQLAGPNASKGIPGCN